MYNLLVSSNKNAWEAMPPIYRYPRDRFLESTDSRLVARYMTLRPETIAELCSIPALFVYELNLNKPARVGRVTNIAQDTGVSLTFELDPRAAPLGRDDLLRLQVALGIADLYELDRNHWIIKDVDLPLALQTQLVAKVPQPDTNRYRIERALGEGGQALVHKAVDLLLNRPVAIKSLEPFFGIAPDERDRERFRREGRALAALAHPNIPAVYDIQPYDSPPRIVFEYIDGPNLLRILRDRKPTLREVCRWMFQVCSALSHAHERGVVHRDIKPANLVLRTDIGTCYLVDFGLAAISGEALRSSSRLVGTPAYMPPEQARGEEVDARADIYSLAVTMYQLLSNKLPAPERYEPLCSFDSAIPREVDDLIQRCLCARESRLASASEFARWLRDAVTVTLSLSLSEVLEHGKLLEDVIRSLENVSPDNLAAIHDDIRRLQARLVRLQGLVSDGQISLTDLGLNAGTSIEAVIIPLEEAVKKFKRQYVMEALDRFRGNRTRAADALGVNVRTVFRMLAQDEKADPNDSEKRTVAGACLRV